MIPLLEDHYEIYKPDFEGHGSSPPKERPFRVKYFAGNLVDYINEHGINEVDVFGYSLGGYVGLYLARFFPKSVKRVFTLGTKFLWTPEFAERENAFLDPGKMREKVPEFAKALQERHVASGWETVLEKAREMHLNLGQGNILGEEDIRQIKKRVRIGVGDRDKMASIEESVSIYRLLPEGELQIFPGTPHPLEKVSLSSLTQSIKEFFN
jgi:pimeloyl-ACP methyl ester carboxylesterase